MRLSFAFLLLLPFLLPAQSWEVGGSAGYGLYRDVNVPGANPPATVGFTSGVAFGALLGQNLGSHLGGEIRYTYRMGDLKVTQGSTEAKADGQSHAIHYDFLLHATGKNAAIRPFLAVGAGVKDYRDTAAEQIIQPLHNVAVLTHTSQAEPLISFGGGMKLPISHRALVRFDIRDYSTPFPDKLLASPKVRNAGWMHDFVFMLGVSGLF
jgi:hypothetical protein